MRPYHLKLDVIIKIKNLVTCDNTLKNHFLNHMN